MVSKIEVKMRNVLINSKPKLKEISRFIQFYLDIQELYNKEQVDTEGTPADRSIRNKGARRSKN